MYTDAQKRSHIFDLQTFLRRIQQSEGSAAPLVPDGIFGAQTAAAVREYQQQHCLPVTGIADQRSFRTHVVSEQGRKGRQFVHRAVSLDPFVGLEDPFAADKGGQPLIAFFRVYFHIRKCCFGKLLLKTSR